jgi:hypothetical protein
MDNSVYTSVCHGSQRSHAYQRGWRLDRPRQSDRPMLRGWRSDRLRDSEDGHKAYGSYFEVSPAAVVVEAVVVVPSPVRAILYALL